MAPGPQKTTRLSTARLRLLLVAASEFHEQTEVQTKETRALARAIEAGWRIVRSRKVKKP